MLESNLSLLPIVAVASVSEKDVQRPECNSVL